MYKKSVSVTELDGSKPKIVKLGGKQIALFKTENGIVASNNRCPHQGFPLSEGHMSDDCVLTCNWHNWKFDLKSGETLVGGDKLRRYPVEIRDGSIWIDIEDPSPEEVSGQCLANLADCFDNHEYDRMAREIARMLKVGADPMAAIRTTIIATHDRFEFGMTHAFAAAADWLSLYDTRASDDVEKLAALVEIVGHMAWDSQRQRQFPFTPAQLPFDGAALAAAIENEDEDRSSALINGGIEAGLTYADFEPFLATAALSHYADFGHAAIYTYKAGQLIARLGDDVLKPVTHALVRMLIYVSREDLIPEFKAYGPALASWGSGDKEVSKIGYSGVKPTLDAIVNFSAQPPIEIYQTLLDQLSEHMLHFDLQYQDQYTQSVSNNVSWLDFTHGITFANAARNLCTKYPDLWPAALLQMGCFIGRNSPFTDSEIDGESWQVSDGAAFLKSQFTALFDHANPEYIVSCHLVKFLSAVDEELTHAPDAGFKDNLLSATNRFLNSPLKRKHVRRIAKQALDFVTLED